MSSSANAGRKRKRMAQWHSKIQNQEFWQSILDNILYYIFHYECNKHHSLVHIMCPRFEYLILDGVFSYLGILNNEHPVFVLHCAIVNPSACENSSSATGSWKRKRKTIDRVGKNFYKPASRCQWVTRYPSQQLRTLGHGALLQLPLMLWNETGMNMFMIILVTG